MKTFFSKSHCRGKRMVCLCIAAVCLVSGTATSRGGTEAGDIEAGDIEAGDIVDTAVASGNFDTLVAAVKAAGLTQTLKGKGPFTVLAPTEKAFERLPNGTLQSLLKTENQARLTAILTYHVVPGRLMARDIYGLNNAATVNGQRVNVSRRDGKLVIGDAGIVATDIACGNGVIHVIDRVLLPEQSRIPAVAEAAGQFSTLLAAVSAAGLAEVLDGDGPFTVFAPTDDAFNSLPENTVGTLLEPENKQKLVDILKQHVVSGRVYTEQLAEAGQATTLLGNVLHGSVTADGLRVNDARVVTGDVEAANGVIHVIDAVLLPRPRGPRQAMRMLEDAIRRGVPVFNRGDHAECADIYTAVCETLVNSHTDQLPDHVMTALKTAVDRAEHIHNPGARAWALRHGIDAALSGLRNMSSGNSMRVQGRERILFSFDEPEAAAQWRITNDDVMGGRSDGQFKINAEKNLEFFGTLSLENNGGFASVRARGREFGLEKGDSIVARIRGDGRDYSLNLYTPTRRTAFSYRANFKTEKDKWIEVRIPLDTFVATSFGRKISGQTLDPSKVNGLGILLGDNKAGPFELELDWIKAVKKN